MSDDVEGDFVVEQDETRLEPDSGDGLRWLVHPSGQLILRSSSQQSIHSLEMNPLDGFWVFKLTFAMDRGRAVRKTANGWYLAVVPSTWQRDHARAGPAPVEPEPTAWSDHTAHYFRLDRRGARRVAFVSQTASHVYPSDDQRCRLVGQHIRDASSDVGPLFGGDAPLCIEAERGWGDIELVVVGQEGRLPPGEKRWRRWIAVPKTPHEKIALSVELSPRYGWYFVRFYDRNLDLADSLDFRYAPGLKSLGRSKSMPLPPDESGHRPSTVTVRHRPDCSIEFRPRWESVQTVSSDRVNTEVTIPASDLDGTLEMTLQSSDAQGGRASADRVTVRVQADRVWWAVAGESALPDDIGWQDRPVCLRPSAFRATSSDALWLRFPRAGWTPSVRIGFSHSGARTIPVRADSQAVSVPLRDFSDADEVAQETDAACLQAWLDDPKECTARLVLVERVFTCRLGFSCGIVGSRSAAVEHTRDRHREVVRQLTYDETRAIFPRLDLPRQIFRCGHCLHYERSDDLARDPTGEIFEHLMRSHPGQEHGFVVVTNVEEIRRNVIANLPSLYCCKWASTYPEHQQRSHQFETRDKALEHVISKHWSDMFREE